ncbi:MAG: NUDIX hydrolase [Leptospirales bacterium]|nr:NUDIX hydrolase [Leptospirales bacterium]
MKFCSACGARLEWRIPEGDTLHRYICGSCQTVHYQNPRMIVGCLPVWQENRVLLCKRANEPQSGKWTLPAGFLENGERAEDGAVRETIEEANASVRLAGLHTVFSVPHIGQVYLLFLAELLNLDFYPGRESLEVRLFTEAEIPWSQLAFNSVRFALERYFLGANKSSDSTNLGAYIHTEASEDRQ